MSFEPSTSSSATSVSVGVVKVMVKVEPELITETTIGAPVSPLSSLWMSVATCAVLPGS